MGSGGPDSGSKQTSGLAQSLQNGVIPLEPQTVIHGSSPAVRIGAQVSIISLGSLNGRGEGKGGGNPENGCRRGSPCGHHFVAVEGGTVIILIGKAHPNDRTTRLTCHSNGYAGRDGGCGTGKG